MNGSCLPDTVWCLLLQPCVSTLKWFELGALNQSGLYSAQRKYRHLATLIKCSVHMVQPAIANQDGLAANAWIGQRQTQRRSIAHLAIRCYPEQRLINKAQTHTVITNFALVLANK